MTRSRRDRSRHQRGLCWHPSGVRNRLAFRSGGLAALDPRLIAAIPPGSLSFTVIPAKLRFRISVLLLPRS